MRVLGIDPGSRFLGYGIVEERVGQPAHVGHGLIKADPKAALEIRLKEIFVGLTQAIDAFRPDAVAVEGVFAFKNARSALILGHARGVALLVAAQTGLAVHEYSPACVKRSIGAGGRGDKSAVARMVSLFLKLPSLERSDVSDALAVAVCHLNHSRSLGARPANSRHGRRDSFDTISERLTPSYQRFAQSAESEKP